MKRIGSSLLVLLAAATTAAAAQTGSPPAARPAGAQQAHPGGAAAQGQRGPGTAGAAQQAGGEIHGVVRDAANGQTLGGAQIAVRSARDSSLVTGAVARADGSFRIEGLRPGVYYLRVSRIGYATGTVSRVAVTPAAPAADVGIVHLSAGALAIAGITATTQRAAVVTAPDRTVVSARNMPTVTGGNATDVLRNVPGVDVDQDGKVSLRGNQNVAIQINGRPAPMTGDALTNFLKQLPANMIDRVEVVPNPSAKYDPDGMGGILNIVMKQNADLGTSGGFTVGAATGDKYNASGNLAGQRGIATLFASYGFNHESRGNNGYNWRDSHFAGHDQTFLQELSLGDFANTSHTFNTNADLKLGARNVLSPAFMLNHRASNVAATNGFTEMDAAQTVTGVYDQLTSTTWRGLTTDYSLGFRRTVAPQKNELSAEVRFNRSRDENATGFTWQPLSGTPHTLMGDAATDLAQVTRTGTAQLDYTRVLGSTKLETGWKGTLRRLDNAYAVDSLSNGVVNPAAHAQNDFRYDENVQAGYGLVTQTLGKLALQGGARLEVARTTFQLAATGEKYPNDYTSLFPSAAATWQLGQTGQVRFSYSRRIQRPDARFLNPFPVSQDPQNRFVGNPQLKPEYTNAFEASVQRSLPFGSLTVTPFYRLTDNVVRRYQTIDTTGVSTVTLRNLATSKSYGADVNAMLRGQRLTGMASFSAYQVVTDGSNVQGGLGANAFTWSARGNLNLKLSPRTDVSWFQFYRAPVKTEQGRMGAMSMANFAIRQKVYGDKASLSLRVQDPLNQMRFSFQTADENFLQISRNRFDSRVLYLSFSYNFGHPPRMRQPRPDPSQQQPTQQPGTPDIPMGGR